MKFIGVVVKFPSFQITVLKLADVKDTLKLCVNHSKFQLFIFSKYYKIENIHNLVDSVM